LEPLEFWNGRSVWDWGSTAADEWAEWTTWREEGWAKAAWVLGLMGVFERGFEVGTAKGIG
jgi:hypothetical protein